MAVHATMNIWPVSSLVQVLACRLFGDKPLPEAMMTLYQLALKQQIWMTIYLKVFLQENIYENVTYEISTILYWPKYVSDICSILQPLLAMKPLHLNVMSVPREPMLEAW